MEVSIQQVEEFINGPVWSEMLKGYEDRKKVHMVELISGFSVEGNKMTMDDINHRRGQLLELEFTIQQPQIIIAELKDTSETKNEDGDD